MGSSPKKQNNSSGDKGGSDVAKGSTFHSRCLRLSAILYGLFIMSENLSLLSKLRFLGLSETKLLTWVNILWFLSLLASIVAHSAKLITLTVKEEKLRIQIEQLKKQEGATAKQQTYIQHSVLGNLKRVRVEDSNTKEGSQREVSAMNKLVEKMHKHNEIKVKHSLELTKNFSDLFIGVQVVGLTKRYLKHDFGESLLGIAGSTSSVIGIYQASRSS
ncbi:hypothetical protein FGO68_gene11110 [Halteria grandinella]|uniref:Uncharacterized protein n=1 Tax=Halteria grandinella TaxID=5974 RepID=A0A8J8NJF9_HALGN|nr:hypothetical protein FGO68_gene11110 [Halteria grandinella]